MSDFVATRRTLLTGAAAATASLVLRPRLALAAAPPRPRTGSALIRLFSNENRYGPCEGAQRAIRESLYLSSRYSSLDVLNAMKQRIADLEGLTPDHVLLTSGSVEVLTCAAAEYAAGGGRIVCAKTTFDVLPTYAERIGGKVHRVPLDAHEVHDLAAMEAAVDADTRLVLVCNPNNPTGTLLDSARLRAFCETVSARTTVLVDEAYLHYVEPAPGLSMVDLVRAGKNVIISRTFSKIYGLAGMRIGYALAPPAVVKRLLELRMGLINSTGLAAAYASLEDTEFVPRMRKLNAESRKLITTVLDDAGIKYPMSHGNFLWFPLRAHQLDLPARFIPHGFSLTTVPTRPIPADVAALRLTLGTVEEMRTLAPLLRAALKA
ncbi:aminotransferase class I/II-fold pyridoxal phosphate-dependent enzyme [Myxococcaceae bacterium JPH2]|nr:aminotransferase class I/II-fold pyridoxal phosphate-dependent enzyme [Myxococcaceae bacterium JPH2]